MSSGLWPCLRWLRRANREQRSGRRMPPSSMKIWATYWMCSARSPDRRREIFLTVTASEGRSWTSEFFENSEVFSLPSCQTSHETL